MPARTEHARAYYSFKLMGALKQTHRQFFDAIHLQRRRLNSVDTIAEFVTSIALSNVSEAVLAIWRVVFEDFLGMRADLSTDASAHMSRHFLPVFTEQSYGYKNHEVKKAVNRIWSQDSLSNKSRHCDT